MGFALIVGNCIVTAILDLIGRKKSHLLTIFPVLLGWFMLLVVNSVGGLIIARFLQGVAMGMLGPLGSIIIGEMTDPKNRGMFLTSVSLALTVGVLLCHTLGSFVSWQLCALICSFTSFTSLLLIIYTPESPAWLISKGRFDEARDVFFWLRGHSEDEETELEKMITAQKMTRKSSVAGQEIPFAIKIKRASRYFCVTCRKPEFYKPITIMVFLYIMFQFAGINVISSYATDIIEQVVGPGLNAKHMMIALDVERLLCNILAVYFMKVLKRRTLLFSTGFICIVAYFGKAGYVYLRQSNQLPSALDNQWIPLSIIGLYMFALTVGISSIPFALSGEIFPLEYRGLGGGISILALSLNFFVAVKCFPVLNNNIGLPLTYVLYASVVIICLTVVWFMLPETKDKTLQDIEDNFRRNSPDDIRSSQPLNPVKDIEMRRCSSVILY